MMTSNSELFERACRVIPGGVNSPVRAFRAVGSEPFFVESARGAYLVDAEGRRYLDYVQSWGASILGHAHPRVVEAVQRAASAGCSYGAPTQREVILAERISELVPSVEKLRLVSSGTEATMSAARVARAATGRDLIVKFSGCYHGHSDGFLAEGGSGIATLGLSGSAGVTTAAVSQTLVAPYNLVPVLDPSVAAVIVEPVAANMGLIAPLPGFLEGLRAECDRVGALLIFDEVITGFRLGLGGAQEFFGVKPDLTCMGKVIGGGLPLAAFGGRADVMEHLAPLGPAYQAGTLSGNPLATAAGLAVLDELDDSAFVRLEGRAAQLGAWLDEVVKEAGLSCKFSTCGTLLGFFFGLEVPATNYEEAKATDTSAYGVFFREMLERRVFLAPSAFEVCFISLAHDKDDLERTTDLAAAAARSTAEFLGIA